MCDFFHQELKGSYTIESVFLMPLAFALLFLFVSMSLISHDRISAAAWMQEQVMLASCERYEETELRKVIPAACTRFDLQICVEKERCTVSCTGNSAFFSDFETAMFGIGKPKLSGTEIYENKYGEKELRKKRLITEE